MIFKKLKKMYLVGVGDTIPINDWNYIPTLKYFLQNNYSYFDDIFWELRILTGYIK